MSAILVQDVDEKSLSCLRARAAAHSQSLQFELNAILQTAAATDEEVLKGWGMALPTYGSEDDLDSVGQLEAYMSECWPNAQPWTGLARTEPEEDELDSVGQLEYYMSTCWPNA